MRIDKRVAIPVFVLLLIGAVFVRYQQLLHAIDYQTGFYIAGSPLADVMPYIIAGGILLIALIVLFGSARDKGTGDCTMQNPFNMELDTLSGTASLIFGVISVLLSAVLLVDIYTILSTPMTKENATSMGTYVNLGLMALSAIIFFRLGIIVFRRDKISRGVGYSMLIPVAWLTVRSTMSFMSFILITNVSANLLILLSVLSMLLFMTLAARFFSGNEKPSTRRMLVIAGLSASLICAISTVPRFLMLLIGPSEIRVLTTVPLLEDLMLPIFAFCVVNMLMKPNRYVIMPPKNFNEPVETE